MKKYLLGLLVIPFSIITITNAGSINFIGDNNNYTPNTITINETTNILNSISNYNCSNSLCSFRIYNGDNDTIIKYEDGNIFCVNYSLNCENLESGTYGIDDYGDGAFNSITISATGIGGSEGGNNGGGIIAGGTEAFSGIITRLGSIFGEFGPYIIFIAIACLGISLLFKALKSLLGFTSGKAKKSIGGREGMKERRTFRRKMRRRTKYATMRSRRTYRRRLRRANRIRRTRKRKYFGLKFGSRGYNSRRY